MIENDLLRVDIAADGTIARLFDKANDRDTLTDRANQLWTYVDKPRSWDAWDVDEAHERDGTEVAGVQRVEVVEAGPVRASVRVYRTWRGSAITQTYQLWAGSRRLDIETEIDWHERQVLLKARFPLAVRTHEATFETMFGVVRRPTHRNTAHDAARFEGSAHRFADLSEPGYGVALLNDGKYGHGVHGNVLTLSLIRSPLYPDALADEGRHRFTYALFPHAGDWTDARVTTEAFALNSPLVVTPASAGTADATPLLTVEPADREIGLGTLKTALDGDGLILRLYEPNGARGPVTLRFRDPIAGIERVNLLEEPADGSPVEHDGRSTVRFDIRPFEVATFRIRLAL